MTEAESYDFFLKLKTFVNDLAQKEKLLDDSDKMFLLKLFLYDVDFITDGSLRDYILQKH